MSDLSRLRRLRHAMSRRAALSRVPQRRLGVARVEEELERARTAGVAVEVLDDQHVLARYDARIREQWLAIDDLYEAAHHYASVEGADRTEDAPNNWMALHFDLLACGKSLAP